MQEPRLSTACSDPGNILYRGERVNNKATGLENCLYGTVNYLVQIDHAVTVVCRHDRCDQDFFILCVCVCVCVVCACVRACVRACCVCMDVSQLCSTSLHLRYDYYGSEFINSSVQRKPGASTMVQSCIKVTCTSITQCWADDWNKQWREMILSWHVWINVYSVALGELVD